MWPDAEREECNALLRSGRASHPSIQSGDRGAQALGNDLCIVAQRRMGIGVPQVALHILDRCEALNVCGRCPAECLVRHVGYAGKFRQWLQVATQIVRDAERGS